MGFFEDDRIRRKNKRAEEHSRAEICITISDNVPLAELLSAFKNQGFLVQLQKDGSFLIDKRQLTEKASNDNNGPGDLCVPILDTINTP